MSEETPPSRPPAPSMRASDEDRERLIAELNEHTVAGRLSTDDLEERLQAAYSARTTAELETLRRDLPVTARQAALEHRTRRAHLTRRMIQESGGSLGLFVVCTVIWLVSGGSGSFWPVWVLVVFVLSVVRNGWALYGPAPDLDAVEAQLNSRRGQPGTRRDQRHDRHRHRHRH
jgi:hypothetical protein